jgi:uncharacterized membrane protein YdjX (TVP38/TMEM64 family)
MIEEILFIIILTGQIFLIGYPKELLLLQGGSTFGILMGTFVNWCGMVLGAQLAYEIARKGSDFFTKFYGTNITNNKYTSYLSSFGPVGLFYLRLLPITPNDLLSVAAGFIKMKRIYYIMISVVTAVPYAFVYAYFGALGIISDEMLKKFNLIILILFILGSAVILSIRYVRNKNTVISGLLDVSNEVDSDMKNIDNVVDTESEVESKSEVIEKP